MALMAVKSFSLSEVGETAGVFEAQDTNDPQN